MDLYNAESNAILSPPTYPTGLNNCSQPVPEHRLQQSLLSLLTKSMVSSICPQLVMTPTASYDAYPVAQAQDNQTGGQQTGINILSAAMGTLQ
ncbi:hypothetical protein DPMN_062815 [Dreissena polymorpha]|uniref:Uncharacterized protein n=1 Tax=Dreissena polymorpha TaxID=45954 RepID=A0A9D4HI27_DREPO|nr:hypothetical protein DPMN_062815 [Dreissena polymorpha]